MVATQQDGAVRMLWRQCRSPIIIGTVILALFFGGFGGWAALAPLASAAVASGIVGPDGNRRTVQHLEGGIIREILVTDGDMVTVGQPLLVLEDIAARAARDQGETRWFTMRALEARLMAELDEADAIANPADLLERAETDPRVAAALRDQEVHFQTRRESMASRVAILRARIAQLREEIAGLEAQIVSLDRQIELIDQEVVNVQILVDQGLERMPRLLSLQRNQAELDGSRAGNRSAIARAEQAIGETELQILDQQSQQREDIASNLANVRAEIASIEEQLLASQDVLARTVIVAPVAGIVVNLQFHTAGGVIGPGSPILDIVPSDEDLIIEARVSPVDIDVVRAGLNAEVHLTAYSQRNLPRLTGVVRTVSADRLTDEATGEPYYLARVEVAGEELASLGDDIDLLPGMPAEVMIATGDRTVIDYLLSPIEDTFRRAFREE